MGKVYTSPYRRHRTNIEVVARGEGEDQWKNVNDHKVTYVPVDEQDAIGADIAV